MLNLMLNFSNLLNELIICHLDTKNNGKTEQRWTTLKSATFRKALHRLK